MHLFFTEIVSFHSSFVSFCCPEVSGISIVSAILSLVVEQVNWLRCQCESLWAPDSTRRTSYQCCAVHGHVECRKRDETIDDGETVDGECRVFKTA